MDENNNIKNKEKFQQLLNWVTEKSGIVNKFNIQYISFDNRYVNANELIEVL